MLRHPTGFALLACTLALFAHAPSAQAQDDFAIRNVRVFDGDRVIPRATVIVRDGRIAAVGAQVPLPEGITEIDGSGQTLLPGLIDAHTHTPWRGFAETALMFGVTTLLDMFSPVEPVRIFRKEQLAGRAHDRADVFSSTIVVTAPGGHGTQYGLPIPTLGPGDDAHAFVGDRVAEGADYIKVIYEDGSSYGVSFPTFDEETVAAIVRAAHDNDRLAVIHVSRLLDARIAVRAGADGLVHVWADQLPDQADLLLLSDRGGWVIPTLAVIAAGDGRDDAIRFAEDILAVPWLRSEEREQLTRLRTRREGVLATFANAMGSVTRLAAAGVPILAGTDAPNDGTAHGVSLHHELVLLVEAGLEPIEALRAATSVPADAFGLADRGRIAPGLRADLVLVEGDPTVDITTSLAISAVWKEGRAVDRESFRRVLERR